MFVGGPGVLPREILKSRVSENDISCILGRDFIRILKAIKLQKVKNSILEPPILYFRSTHFIFRIRTAHFGKWDALGRPLIQDCPYVLQELHVCISLDLTQVFCNFIRENSAWPQLVLVIANTTFEVNGVVIDISREL